MAKEEKKVPTLEEAISNDEYNGKAGSYLYDPVTGKRTPIEPEEKK